MPSRPHRPYSARSAGRRSSAYYGVTGGFSPLSISGLVAWYDFSDITTLWKNTARTSAVTTDGDIILGVTDKSATGNHLSEATNGPAYKVNIQNGRSVSLFDGTNDILRATGSAVTQPNTTVVVGKIVVDDGVNSTTFLDGATNRQIVYKDHTTGNWAFFANNAVAGSIAADTSFHLLYVVFNGASSVYRVDLAANTVTTPGAASWSNFTLATDGVVFANVEIAEVLVYNSALSTANRDSVEAYLRTKWGTP